MKDNSSEDNWSCLNLFRWPFWMHSYYGHALSVCLSELYCLPVAKVGTAEGAAQSNKNAAFNHEASHSLIGTFAIEWTSIRLSRLSLCITDIDGWTKMQKKFQSNLVKSGNFPGAYTCRVVGMSSPSPSMETLTAMLMPAKRRLLFPMMDWSALFTACNNGNELTLHWRDVTCHQCDADIAYVKYDH